MEMERQAKTDNRPIVSLQDIDVYKSMVKDEIHEWISVLKSRNISDWLIVVVVYDESKVKSKLLRTSVIDRVKSDFCSRNGDRYLPFKLGEAEI